MPKKEISAFKANQIVGIVIGVSDYFTEILGGKKSIYLGIATACCLLGIVIGQFNVHYIFDIALPVLMFIYPITIFH